MMRPLTLLSAILLLFTVSACDGSGNQAGQTGEATQSEVAGDADLQQKLNVYTGAFNLLIAPRGGLAAYAEAYNLLNIPNAEPSNTLTFQSPQASFQGALDSIRKARDIDGGDVTADLDASADQIIPPLEAVLSHWRELEPYYKSRAYREDDLKKGKAADASLKAAFADSTAALSKMADALTVIQRERGEQRIAALREAGHVAEASFLTALQKADYFVSAISRNELDEAKRLAPEFEAALEEMRSNEERYAGPEHGKVLYGVLAGTLTRVIGSWRDYEASKDEFNLNTLINFYNSAVRTAGSIPMPA